MPVIVTSIYDPVALAATCRRLNVPLPEPGSISLDDRETSGWVVRLPGVRHPIVCNTLTGLIAYHADDNGFRRYARIMSFIYRYYDVKTQQHLSANGTGGRPSTARQSRRSVLAG
jgi:hypothetical protein